MRNLVIVESPTKAKTISKFLSSDYTVKSSFGHIRDLPEKEMGIDVDNHFQPTYVVPKDKRKIVDDLKKAAKKSDNIYFATDADREGEAIAWHLVEILKPKNEQIKRITFHEITKSAINEALKEPRKLDLKRVDAQQARRLLDRLVGYELSPFLWKKVARGLSAGRVQSVAVRLIVEREREIQKFKAREYWTIESIFNKLGANTASNPSSKRRENLDDPLLRNDGERSGLDIKNLPAGFFAAKLQSINDKPLGKFALGNEKDSQKIIAALKNAAYKVAKIESKQTKKSPLPPFTTSTLQQEANRKFGFSSRQTMRLAQQLYEGVDIGDNEAIGLITYMRTDSVSLSQKFLDEAKQYITGAFGKEYSLAKARIFKTKSRTAQEAHEAIRPTEVAHQPGQVQQYLDPAQYKLYDLVWRRAVATQMAEAILDNTAIDVTAKTDATYSFRSTGQTVKFAGYLKIYPNISKDSILPDLKKGEKVNLARLDPMRHFTEPPARYSDASLVKAMEEREIGRPSTYAPTISTIIDRNYAQRIENRRLKPTDMAFLVNDILVEHFPQIVDYKFTARLEEELDEIAEGKMEWEKAIQEFYDPFKKNLMEKTDTLTKKELTEEKTDEVCGKCGKPMVIKTGRFGRFLACTGYPDCKNTKPINGNGEPEEPETTDEKCPECGSPMQVKHGRYGKFLGCSKYPDCKGIKKIEKGTGVKCPECGKGEIVEKKSKRGKTFYACNQYPDCKTAFFAKPVNEKCPQCKSQLVFGAKGTYKCSNKECGFSKKAE